MSKKSRKPFVIAGISLIVFFRPLISGLTYPWSNTYIQSVILILSMIWLLQVCWSKGTFFRTHLDIPILTFFLFIGVSSLKSVGSAVSLSFIYQFMSYVLLFFLVANNLRTEEARRAVIFALFLSTFLLSIYGIYQYFWGLDITRMKVALYHSGEFPPEFMTRLGTDKVFSTFVFPPALAGFLLLVMPLSISMGFVGRSRFERIFCGFISFPLILWCLILTFSKGGWVSAVLSMVVFVFIWLTVIKRVKKNVVAIGVTICVLIFILLIVFDCLPKATFSGFIGSFGVRVGYWKSIPPMVRDFFLIGSGPGTFGIMYPGYRILLGRETQMAHNNYLQVLVETGVFGLVAFLWIWIRFLRRGIRLIFAEKVDRMLILACFAGIIGFLIQGFVDFGLYVPGITMTVFLFLGLIEAKENVRPLQFSVKKGTKVFLTIVILTVTTYMMWAVRRPMLGERCFGRAIVCTRKGELDKSISLLKKAIEYCPQHAKYYFQLGLIYEGKKGRVFLNKAIESYEMAVRYNPYMASYHSKLSLLYWFKSQRRDRKLMEKAILEMENAVSCYPVMPKYHKHLGRLYHLAAKSQGSILRDQMYEKAREQYMLTVECKDAIYRTSEKAELQEMLEQVGVWLSELENET